MQMTIKKRPISGLYSYQSPVNTERSSLIWFPSENQKMEGFINPSIHLLTSFWVFFQVAGAYPSCLQATDSIQSQCTQKYENSTKNVVRSTGIPSESIILQITSFSWKNGGGKILFISAQTVLLMAKRHFWMNIWKWDTLWPCSEQPLLRLIFQTQPKWKWPFSVIITHPDAQLHILSSVHLHPLIQQTDLFKVQPVHHKAANQGRTPGELKMGKIRFVSLHS